MRKLLITIVIVLAAVGVAAIYLVSTTPSRSSGVRFPLTAEQTALIAQVPTSAESFAFIPTAAALDSKLRSNPITRDALNSWESDARHRLPRGWMIGGADLLAWRDDRGIRFLLRLDPFRATLVRVYMMVAGDIGNTLLINAPAEAAIDLDELTRISNLAEKLPAGDALVVQRQASRGAFPPIGRPAVTSVQVSDQEINVVSRAARDAIATDSQSDKPAKFPRSAMLTGTFASMPRVVEELNRLFGTKVSPLLQNGGTIAIYDVETRKLLPRPLGVIAVPADDDRRRALEALTGSLRRGESLGVNVQTKEQAGELLLSFDRSIDLYSKDTFEVSPWPAGRWSVRADPRKLVPVLRKLNDSIGLRVASPRLFRSARDLNRWLEAFESAVMIEAGDADDGPAEQIRVRLVAK